MKKHLLTFMAMLLCSFIANAGDYFTYSGIDYRITSPTTVEVEGLAYFYKPEKLDIPSTVNNYGTYNVTSIGDRAFESCYYLTSITIPESVTSIGDFVFHDCSNLTSIVVAEGNKVYDSRSGCNAIIETSSNTLISGCTKTIIPEGVTSIGMGAFYECRFLTSITIPESVTSIGDIAFGGCSSLTSITLPEGMTSIGYSAFHGCSSLTSINIPASVTSIGYSAFKGCSSLTAVHISSIEAWCKISFGNDANPLSYAHNLYLNGKLVTKLVIPEGVTSIRSNAFEGCSSLTSITLPESVTSIGWYVFYGCSSLKSITIPENSQLTSIGKSAFSNCSSLKSITIPEGVTSIGEYTFNKCSSLTSVSIPENSQLTSIGKSAFYGCSSLTAITIPENSQLTSIGENAFYGCSSLTAITIPEGVTSIGSNAFEGCSSLTAVHISSIEAWCKISFGNSYTNPLSYAQNLYLNGVLVTKLVIPEGVTSIGEYAFYGCSSLVTILIPEGLTSIGKDAFKGCKFIRIVTHATLPPKLLSEENEFNTNILLVPSTALSAYEDSSWKQYCKKISCVDEIFNPSFEGDTYNCDNGMGNGNLNAPEGWTVTYTNADWGWKNFQLVKDGKQQHGNQYFEFWAQTYHTLDLSQEVYDLPAGSYVVCAAMRTERADQVTNQHIYAKVGNKTYKSATLGAPPIESAWNAVDAWQTLLVEFTLNSRSNVVIGATSTGGANSKGWFQIDNFRLGPPISDIHLSQSSATIKDGDTLSLVATIIPSDAAEYIVTWSSSDNTIATVDDNGEVIAKGVGTAIITATAGRKSATCAVTVEKLPVSSISLSRTYAALAGDESITLTATVSPDNASYKTVTWSSSNEDVATVDNGKVTAKSAGVATITATADGVTAVCEVNVNGWKFDNATGHLFVNDVIDRNYYTSYPWYEISGNVLSVEFGDQATTIGKQAFAACASLMTVTMSDSVKSIGDEAFYECIGLMNVDFSNNLEYIGDYAFTRCAGLMSVTMNDSVKSIGDYAFTECIGLMSVEFSNNLESIGDYAFAQCVGLTSIDIPNSISNIQNYAFADCDGLINVFIPSSVTNIGNGAFADCDGLSSIVIPSSVITIGSNTFSNCDGLTSIVIPNSVKTIGGSAFQGCSMLNKLVVGNGVGIIGVSAFEGCEKLKTVINFSNLDIVKGATTHGYVAYYADIVVTDGLALNQTTLELTTGESAILTAIVASGDNNAVTWSSSNENIATVNNGEVTALAAGTTTITAKTGDYEATCVVTVTQKFITVSNITLSHTEVALTEGETLTLKATVSPDDATDKTVTWSSNNENVAAVDGNGNIVAVAAGIATITAKAGDHEATCVVTVKAEETIAMDVTNKVGTGRDTWEGNNGGPVTIDGISMPEKYETTTATLGDVMWQTVTGLENGKYTVELWANARYTPDRGFGSDAADGALDFTYLYANNVEISIEVYHNGSLNNNKSYKLEGVEVTDGTLKMGMTKKAAGSNWHTIQIKSLIYHAPANAALDMAKVDLQAALDAANAVDPKNDDFVATIAAAQAVYDNSKSVEEIEATTASLKEATKLAILMNATEENPVLTDFVVNGTFDSAIAPWKSTTGAQNQALASNQQGAFTGNFFENWNGSNYTGKLYQVIEDIPNGVYELSICAFVETFDASAQFVYANGDKVALTTGAPTAYTVRTIVENNTIEVGFEQTAAVNRWCGIDNVSLTYLGEASNEAVVNAAKEAFTAAYEEFGTALAACQAMMLKMSFAEIDDAAYQLNAQLATTTDVDALTTMAATLAEATAALKEINEVYAGYDAFVQKFKAAAEISEPMTTEAAELLEYNMSGGAGMQAASLEALAQAVETIKADYFTYIANANLLDGNKFDLTYLIENPNIDHNLDGWTLTGRVGRLNNNGFNGVPGIMEIGEWGASAWEAGVSQTLNELPNGKYIVKMAWMAAFGIKMNLSVNEVSVEVTGIGDQGGNIAADGSVVEMGQGVQGWQYAEVEALVENSTLTIAVSSSSAAQFQWSNADQFQLYYAGSPESTGIKCSVLEAQGSQLIYDLHGRRVAKMEKGIYIVNGKKIIVK